MKPVNQNGCFTLLMPIIPFSCYCTAETGSDGHLSCFLLFHYLSTLIFAIPYFYLEIYRVKLIVNINTCTVLCNKCCDEDKELF